MTSDHYSSRILWSDEDEAFVALSPELEGVSALGATAEEALTELRRARALWLEEVEGSGLQAPAPAALSRRSGQFRVRLPRSLHDWLADRAEHEGVSLNTLVVQLLSEARGGVLDPARRLIRLGGSEPGLEAPRRRRGEA